MVKVRRDLTGRIYGDLTVIKQIEDYINPKGKHSAKWLCQCQCGNFTAVTIANLTGGGVRSCGQCPHDKVRVRENLVGTIFGRLTVKQQVDDYVSPQGQHKDRWLCECICGKETIVVGESLKLGEIQSCGCYKIDNSVKLYHKTNSYDIENYEYGIGWTLNTNNAFYFDLEDYDKIKNICWVESGFDTYHRLVGTDTNTHKQVKFTSVIGCKNYDHENRNPLDNRKSNLRPCTAVENARNRSKQLNNKSGYIGVFWHKQKQTWVASVTINRKQLVLGYYTNKIDALIARLKGELKYYGIEFAPQRDLFEQYGIINTEQNNCNMKEENNE